MTEALLFCPKCGTSHAAGATFCQKCGMPLSQLAMSGPYESILTEGFGYREAANRPRKLIVVAGMLLIFVPILVYCLGALGLAVISLFSARAGPSGTPIECLVLLGGAYVSGKLIIKTLRNYLKQRREEIAADAAESARPVG